MPWQWGGEGVFPQNTYTLVCAVQWDCDFKTTDVYNRVSIFRKTFLQLGNISNAQTGLLKVT